MEGQKGHSIRYAKRIRRSEERLNQGILGIFQIPAFLRSGGREGEV